MKRIYRFLRKLFSRPAPTDEQIAAAVKSKILEGGGFVGDNFDFIASSIDMSTPYLISIGNDVTLTGVKVLTHDASLKKSLGYSKVGAVSIGNNVFVGWGSIILMNTKIGNNVIIGAGSVVCKDIPDNSVAVGNPCRVIGSYDEYLDKMKEKMHSVPVIDSIPSQILDSTIKDKLQRSGLGFVL
jgi:maltose O-acetyltransferase